jgi:hypothetical protein
MGKPAFTLAVLGSNSAAWPTDTTGSGFRPRGYVLDGEDQPAFKYDIHGARVLDAPKVTADGQGLERTITVDGAPAGLVARIVSGSSIEQAGNGMYLVDGKSYFLRLNDGGGANPQIRDGAGGTKELVIPVKNKLTYTILY